MRVGRKHYQFFRIDNASSVLWGAVSLKKSSNCFSIQARISVYSVQKYGQKTLYGSADFLIVASNHKALSLMLQNCGDNNSSIKFTYGLYRIESRASSLNKSVSSSKAASHKVKNSE